MTLDELNELLDGRPPAPIYPTGWRAFRGALWQRLRHRTWTAYAPADDRGVERSHAHAEHAGGEDAFE